MTYLAAMACARISVLLLYTRLFGIKRAFRYTCYTLMTLVVGYSLALILVEIFQCRPISAGWNFFAPGHCASLPIVTIANGGLNILSDFAVVVAPIPLVSRLQLRRANMIGLLAIFSTGLLYVMILSQLLTSLAHELQYCCRSHHTCDSSGDISAQIGSNVEPSGS